MTRLLERPREASIVSNPEVDASAINPHTSNAVTPVMARPDEFQRYTLITSNDAHRGIFNVEDLVQGQLNDATHVVVYYSADTDATQLRRIHHERVYSHFVGLSGEASGRLSALFPYWLTSKPVGLTRFQLLEAAGKQLTRLVASGEAKPSPRVLAALNTVVTSFAADGGPTPQLAATEHGSIEIAWVVGEMAVGAIFAEDGSYSVWAEDAPHHELFDLDIDDAMPTDLHRQIADLLATMGTQVIRPVPFG